MRNKQQLRKGLQIILKPIFWFAASLQGADGKASGKKFTAAFLTFIAGMNAGKVGDLYALYAFISLLVTVLMMWGIITTGNIITLTRTITSRQKGGNKTDV